MKNNNLIFFKKINNYYYILFLIPLIFIFLYGNYRCTHKTFKDPLEKTIGINGLDGWSLTHFFFFMTVGYLFPYTIFQTMILGILWELFEHIYGKHRPGWLGGYGGACNNMATDKEHGNWWYGKWSDIMCNLIGFLIGSSIF